MQQVPANRGAFVRAVCVLCVALMCVIGMAQATHSHPDDSATSHHTCTICATAHVGVKTASVAIAPVLNASFLAISVVEVASIFRPGTTQFIRPPPAF